MERLQVGDCLDVLGGEAEGSFDLAYLDPPFCTGRTHRLTTRADGYEYQFSDEWSSLSQYLRFMRERLTSVRRVMKETASIYLHCDRSASHHLRLLLDEVFGADNFRAEIIWSYRRWSNAGDNLQGAHQTIFMYSKSERYTFNRIFEDYSPATNLDQIMQRRQRDGRGKTVYDRSEDGVVILSGPKQGVPLSDVWDIPYLNPKARERTGYPTQKPLLLLERIICLSSNLGDNVLEPFCGSGTAVVAAQRLGRGYLGIDTNAEAIALAESRLANPVFSRSRLLERGRGAYEELPVEVRDVLAGLAVKPVQRNSGIDGICDRYIGGRPVLVRVQRRGEELGAAAAKLRAAGRKKDAALLVLLQTEPDGSLHNLFAEYSADTQGVVVIPSAQLNLEALLDRCAAAEDILDPNCKVA